MGGGAQTGGRGGDGRYKDVAAARGRSPAAPAKQKGRADRSPPSSRTRSRSPHTAKLALPRGRLNSPDYDHARTAIRLLERAQAGVWSYIFAPPDAARRKVMRFCLGLLRADTKKKFTRVTFHRARLVEARECITQAQSQDTQAAPAGEADYLRHGMLSWPEPRLF
jgi:hypothetical protein